jgi:hypothetical protein
MQSIPVIDALFKAILNADDAELARIQQSRSGECVNVRALICTDQPGAIDLDLGLGLASCEFVSPIFEKSRAWLVSRDTVVQERLTGGRSNVPIDHSLAFDSNFADKLFGLVEGRHLEPVERERVLQVLRLKGTNNRVQFDVMPFLAENARLARDNADNERPLATLVAFRLLDYLDWDAFRSAPDKLRFTRDVGELQDELRPEQARFLQEFYTSQSVLRLEATAQRSHALLLRLAKLRQSHGRDITAVMRGLIDFALFELGFLPVTELTLIWSGISGKQGTPFFGPVINPSVKVVKAARGMAWDMAHLRLLQEMARQTTLGSFAVPYFVSFDARWRELLRLNPIRILLIDDSTNAMNIGRTRDLEFHRLLNDAMSPAARHAMSPDQVEARREFAKTLDKAKLEQLVANEATAWV